MDEDRRSAGSDRRKADRRAPVAAPLPEPAPEYVTLEAISELVTESEAGEKLKRPDTRLLPAALNCRDCGRVMIAGRGPGYLRCGSLELYDDMDKPPKGAKPATTVIYCGGWEVRS